MTFGKASILGLGFVGAVALGVWMAPYVTDQADGAIASADTTVAASSETEREPARVRRAPAAESATLSRIDAVPPSSPDLQARLKPVLAPGTRVEAAAEGFESSEQFAIVAHLARNTGVPFVLLKHRVLDQGVSPAEAVRMSKPDVDTTLELNRARAAAHADIWG